MASHADTFGHRCPDCGADSTAQMWPVIDAADDPELLRRLTTGDLLHGMCPHCRAAYLIAYPATVLVHRPALRPPLLFGVLPRTPPERQERYLATALVRLGRPPKGMDVEIVPIGLLPVVADRDVETDLAAVRDGTFHGLSPRLQEYADWLRALDHERWKAALQGPLSALLDAAGPAECRRLVEEHPQLLTDEVDELLAQIIEVAEQDHGTPTADIARHRRMLLQQCRRLGTAAVFGGHPPPPPPPSAEPGLSGAAGAALLAVSGHRPTSPDELRDLLTRALLEISPPEAGLHLSIEDELIGLADFFALQLAEELVKHPRDPADFTEAMRLCARLDGLRDSAPVAWAMAQHNGALARGRAAPPGDITALDEARAGFERALTVRTAAARPQDWAVTVIALANLLTGDYPSHLTRYTDEAIRLLEQAVDTAVPLEETDRRSLRFTYGSALLRRAERGDDDALTRATAELERLRDGTRDELFPLVRSNLGMALSRRAERTGRHADWRRAVEVLRETVGAGTADERQLIGSMGNLGIALRHSGEVEEAVALFGRAIERCAAAGWWVAWAGMQNNLGTALLDRVTGDRDENVAAAVEAYEQARLVWTRERFPAEWAQTTARLAAAHDELPGGRQRAGELFGEAVATIPRDRYPVAWARLTNRHAGHLAPAAAVTGYRAAAEVLTREAFPHEWAAIQHNLAGALRNLGARDDAIACYRSALDVRPRTEAPLEWAGTAASLAGTVAGEGCLEEAEALLGSAVDVLRDGAPATDLLRVAAQLAVLRAQRGQWPAAAKAFRDALAAADRIYAAALLRSSRERTLGEHGWLYPAAAYVAVRQDRCDEAVDILERGRARMLADALARDPEGFEDARRDRPREYAAYRAAVEDLVRAEAAGTRLTAEGGDPRYRGRAEQAVRHEIRRCVAVLSQARAALPAPEPEVVAAPGHAVVYLFTTGRDCTALVVGPAGVDAVPLPDFDGAKLARSVHGDGTHPGLIRQQTGRAGFAALLDECLAEIGRTVVAGLAAQLRQRGVTAVTLIPVGLFSAVPLHAAPMPDGRCLLDDFVVSYAPSAAVLAAARRSGRQRAGRPRRGLAVVDPGAGLPLAGYEAALLTAWTGDEPVDGSTAGVLDRLAGATHVHFACHGRSIVDQPLRSHLDLGGGRRLELLDLLATERTDLLRATRLVVASACQTATVDAGRTPDEFVGLAAGFLLAGVPVFVGTLWPAGDVPTALLMTRFYELYLGDRRPVDEALCTAQTWLRDLTGEDLVAYAGQRPRLAAAAPQQLRIARQYPDRRFFAGTAVWSPYVLIGASAREEERDDRPAR